MSRYYELKQLFDEICRDAGPAFKTLVARDDAFDEIYKGADGLPTTRIDHELEALCLSKLERSKLFTEVLSEEAGIVKMDRCAYFSAVLDPLDGTSNAKMGFPYCALSLAVKMHDTTVAGLVYNYNTGDIFLGFRGEGATLNSRSIVVNDVTVASQARIVTSRPFSEHEALLYSRFMTDVKRVRVVSSPALDTAYVASGTFTAYVDFHTPKGLIHAHDVLAARLILEEAGGYMLDDRGSIAELPTNATDTVNIFAVNSHKTFHWIKSYFDL